MNSYAHKYPSRFYDNEPNKWFTDVFLPAMALLGTLFFGIEAIQNRDSPPEIGPGENTGQVCETFYREMHALTEAGLTIEGLAQIEDKRESLCGPAHTVPYVWEVQSSESNENNEEDQPNPETPPANAD